MARQPKVIVVRCPACASRLKASEKLVGKRTKCPRCKQPVKFAPQRQEPTLAPSPPPAPASVDQLLQEGIAQIQRGDLAAGQATLRRVVIHAPDNATAWLWMGWVAIGQRDQHIAEVCFTQAHRLGHPKANTILTALRQGQPEPVSAGFVGSGPR